MWLASTYLNIDLTLSIIDSKSIVINSSFRLTAKKTLILSKDNNVEGIPMTWNHHGTLFLGLISNAFCSQTSLNLPQATKSYSRLCLPTASGIMQFFNSANAATMIRNEASIFMRHKYQKTISFQEGKFVMCIGIDTPQNVLLVLVPWGYDFCGAFKKNAYELINLRALKFSTLYKIFNVRAHKCVWNAALNN